MTPEPTPEILCAQSWFSGCNGTGFWPGFPGWDFLGFILSLTVVVAVIVFAVRYWSIRQEMDE